MLLRYHSLLGYIASFCWHYCSPWSLSKLQSIWFCWYLTQDSGPSQKGNLMLITFSAAALLWSLIFCNLIVYSCMAAHLGTFHALPLGPLKLFSITFLGVFGTYHEIATRVFYNISLPAYQVCTILFSSDPHLFSLLLYNALKLSFAPYFAIPVI